MSRKKNIFVGGGSLCALVVFGGSLEVVGIYH